MTVKKAKDNECIGHGNYRRNCAYGWTDVDIVEAPDKEAAKNIVARRLIHTHFNMTGGRLPSVESISTRLSAEPLIGN
jgi:hypothetical protein